MMQLLHPLLILFMGKTVAGIEHVKFESDPLFADKLCTNNHIEFESPSKSKLHCVWLCKTGNWPGCGSVIYHGATGTCYGLTSSIACATWSGLPGARYYRPQTGCESPGPLVPGCADAQLTASSIWTSAYQPYYGRLNYPTSYWSVKTDTLDQYIQVDFLSAKIITDVITQGGCCDDEWTTSYKVLTSIDCGSFTAIKDTLGDDRVFLGNSDRTTLVSHTLDTPVVARCVRLYPQTYYTWPSLRFEVLGCSP